MELVLLGSGGYHPSDRRQTACVLLPEAGVLFDAGTGMYRVAAELRSDRLSVFLTHAHLDHVIGLTYLFSLLQVRPGLQVTVHATDATRRAVEEHLFAPEVFPTRPPLEFAPLAPTTPVAGRGTVTAFDLEHPGGAMGFRFDGPTGSVAYVTDTTAAAGADYLGRIRGLDLLLHECFFDDADAAMAARTGHSCASAVASLAHQAGVGRLVLVHLNPLDGHEPAGLAAAREIFPAVEVGFDRMRLEF